MKTYLAGTVLEKNSKILPLSSKNTNCNDISKIFAKVWLSKSLIYQIDGEIQLQLLYTCYENDISYIKKNFSHSNLPTLNLTRTEFYKIIEQVIESQNCHIPSTETQHVHIKRKAAGKYIFNIFWNPQAFRCSQTWVGIDEEVKEQMIKIVQNIQAYPIFQTLEEKYKQENISKTKLTKT